MSGGARGAGERRGGRGPGPRLHVLAWLALRNARRNLRRSLLTAAATAAGLALLIFFRAIGDGMHDDWILSGVRLASGHVVVQARGYRADPGLAHRLDGAALAATEAALRQPALAAEVARVSPRLTVSGLASAPGSALPVQVQGVDPARELGFSPLTLAPDTGRFLRPDDRLAAFVGIGLAERLDLQVGSRLVLSAQGAGGDIAEQLVRVVGIFHSGVPEVDRGVVQIPLATARAWLGVPAGATSVAVLLHGNEATPVVTAGLRRALRRVPDVAVLTWRQSTPELDAAVRMDNFGDYVFHAILFFIVALAILNAVLMSVLNRTREFGVLEALGLTPGETGRVVFLEGLLLTAIAGLAGVVLGLGVTWGLWRHGLDLSFLYKQNLTLSGALVNPVVVPEFRVSQVLWSLVWIAVIGVAASFYPARQAARIDPANAMKFER